MEDLLSRNPSEHELATSLDTPTASGGGLAVARLTTRQRLIPNLRFSQERTRAQIGAQIGVSQMQVSRLLQPIEQLHRDLGNDTELRSAAA